MKEIINLFNLQLFADAGTLVNATGSYVNAYTGDTTAFDGTNTMSGELKTFYDTELLENARIEMYYAQFAKKQTLPKNHGGTVEWRKFNTFKKASRLVEGVIPEGQKGGVSTKTGYISQYGTYVAVTDILEMRAYDDIILGYTEEMGASASETQETLIRDALLTNTNEYFCDNITLATGAVAGTPTAHSGMEASGTVMSMLTPKMVAKIVTKLKKGRVPTINGKYYAVIHPSCAHDIRQSEEWIEAHKYTTPENIFKGEIGELQGFRFIESPECTIIEGAAGGKDVYVSYALGANSFGEVDAEGEGAEMILKGKEQAGGPLEQWSTCGFKFTHGGTVLYPERCVRFMSVSTFGEDTVVESAD